MRTIVPSVRTLVLISLLVSSSLKSFAQSITSGDGKYEIGIGIGPLFFLGDLGGAPGTGKTFVKDVDFPLTKVSKGIYANVYPTEWFGFRIGANHGVLEGDDAQTNAKGGAEEYRKARNLKFQSTMIEAYAGVEFYPTVFFEQYDGLQGKLRPYGMFGLGVFHFNPKGEYTANGTSQWVELQPLRLEGQGMGEYPNRKPYSLTQLHMPMAIGAKYYLKENMYIGLEILHRKTFTDYVDDVSTTYIDNNLFQKYLTPEQTAMANQLYYRSNLSGTTTRPPYLDEQRGDPKENDAFFSSLIRCGWRLNDRNSPGGRAARMMRCPSFY